MADLQTLFNSIPTAADGGVITKEYHNTMRDTISAVIDQLGASQTATLTYAPTFFQVTAQDPPQPTWRLAIGGATISVPTSPPAGVQAGTNMEIAFGWLPIQLPEGVHIQRLAVVGQKAGTNISNFSVQLERQPITSTDPTALITIPLTQNNGSFNATRDIPTSQLGIISNPATIEDYELVQNSTYKYLVTALVLATVPDTTGNSKADIYAIQVTYRN